MRSYPRMFSKLQASQFKLSVSYWLSSLLENTSDKAAAPGKVHNLNEKCLQTCFYSHKYEYELARNVCGLAEEWFHHKYMIKHLAMLWLGSALARLHELDCVYCLVFIKPICREVIQFLSFGVIASHNYLYKFMNISLAQASSGTNITHVCTTLSVCLYINRTITRCT